MNRQILSIPLAIAITLATLPVRAEEAVRWVDDKGRVHFSDKAPTNQKDKVETVKLPEAPKQGLSEQEVEDLKKKANSYTHQLELERTIANENQQRQASSGNPPAPTPPPTSSKMTREDCRNQYPKIGDRVRCFRSIEGNSGE